MNKECKLALAYLREKRAAACLLAAAVAFLFLITELYHAPRELAVYTSLMLGTGSALAFAAGLYRYRAVHNALWCCCAKAARRWRSCQRRAAFWMRTGRPWCARWMPRAAAR